MNAKIPIGGEHRRPRNVAIGRVLPDSFDLALFLLQCNKPTADAGIQSPLVANGDRVSQPCVRMVLRRFIDIGPSDVLTLLGFWSLCLE